MARFRLRYLISRDPSFSLPVVIKEKIMKDLGQPRFQIGSPFELLVSREGTNKGFLDQILGIGRIFCQMKCHPIQMIEMNHGLTCNRVALSVACFWLPGHAGILTNRKGSV